MDIRQELIKLRTDLFDFSKRNPLVHVSRKKLWFPEANEPSASPDKLLRKADFLWREYGLETCLAVDVFLKWSPPQEKGKTPAVFYTSPLFYRPAKIKRVRKIETHFALNILQEEYLVNPVLRHYFKLYYDLELPVEIDSLNEWKQQLETFFNSGISSQKLVQKTNFNEADEWQLIQQSAVGNFNYKKSALGADYTRIIESPNDAINGLLSGDVKTNENQSNEADDFRTISFLDMSQREVIARSLSENAVIQGPPGTGKSHTIVALIGALLLQRKKVLFVSEKRSALEVVYQRLVGKGLGTTLAYFNTQKDQKKAYYQNLRSTWEEVNRTEDKRTSDRIKGGEHPLFDIYPDLLKRPIDSLGTNLNELIDCVLELQLNPADLAPKGKTPGYKSWKEALPILQETEQILNDAFGANAIGKTQLVQLNSMVFSESDVAHVLDKRLVSMLDHLGKMRETQVRFNLGAELDQLVKLALTASILAMVDRVQIDLLNNDSKKYKSFDTWAKKYQLLKSKLGHAVQANQKWSRKPSMSEITELMGLLTNAQRRSAGILGRLRRNPEKLKTAFRDFHSGIGDHSKIKLLESLQLEWRLSGELDELKIKLRHNLGIKDPDNEIELIYNLRNKLSGLSKNEYIQILEHEESAELIRVLSELHPDILQFNAQNRFLFQGHDLVTLTDWTAYLEGLKETIPAINHWLPELKRFFKLPGEIRQFLGENPEKLEYLNAVVAYQNLLEETRFYPQFKSLTGWELTREIKRILEKKQAGYQASATEILTNAKEAHQASEELLSKPGFKLDADQKHFKKEYKRQKRLIIHEINKQQRFLPVKSFFESTGNHLLELQPVWMMNPLTVSEFLPCEEAIFDVVIFDESSQIPLEDAIPAIYRADQVVVVGDSKQMPPSSFFTSKDEIKTLLDQAEQTFSNTMLKWHYRSKHPDLIRFSNAEFYQNELITFPPQTAEEPIELNLVEGNYQSGKNPKEAKELVDHCVKLIKSGKKSILIIAFSKEQEQEIGKGLKKHGLLDEPLITLRNLENAQGIESDIVLVSIGYGVNESGDFRLNFGPVNRANGANRLNVLFTRAIEKMIVFTSVKSTDFGYSDNSGVQLLKDFLAFAENRKALPKTQDSMPLAHQMVTEILNDCKANFTYYPAQNGIGFTSFIHHTKNSILLVDPGIDEQNGEDILGILTVLKRQYKNVKIVLSLDLWLNFDRVKADLETYFG